MGKKDPPKPDPYNPDNKGWGGGSDEGQCTTCGGSGTVTRNGKSEQCGSCYGSGKR